MHFTPGFLTSAEFAAPYRRRDLVMSRIGEVVVERPPGVGLPRQGL